MNKFLNLVGKKHIISLQAEKVLTSEYVMQFSEDIKLQDDVDYQIGLVWFEGTNSIPNISTKENNNKFKYYNGTVWKTLTIPDGGYEINILNEKIQKLMKDNNDYLAGKTDKYYITLTGDVTELNTSFEITNGYKIDFSITNSFNDLIGFDNIILHVGTHKSTNTVEMAKVKTIKILTNLTTDWFVNGSKSNVLYSSPIPSPMGYSFKIFPKNVIWLPFMSKSFNNITFSFKDSRDKLIDFRGYSIDFLVMIKQI